MLALAGQNQSAIFLFHGYHRCSTQLQTEKKETKAQLLLRGGGAYKQPCWSRVQTPRPLHLSLQSAGSTR